MKELKDLLKENKYLEVKAFILSNLDKIEECVDDLLDELVQREDPFENWIAQNVDKSLLPHKCTGSISLSDIDFQVGGIPIVGVESIPKDSIAFVSKAKGLVSGVINLGDEHDIVDPKGLDFPYLKSYYDTPNKKIDTLIKKTTKPK